MFSLIVAVAQNNCIGISNQLPWNIPEDLKHFKNLTMGKTVLMGQKTFDSILGYIGKPLPGRKTVVITSNLNYIPPNQEVRVFHSLDEAFEKLKNEDVFVCGGASIYKQTLDRVDILYITEVKKIVEGDVFFPEINKNIWREVEREKHEEFDFVIYKKI